MERFVMSSQLQLIVYFLRYLKSFKVPQPESAVTISRIAQDDEVKPQSKQKKVGL